MMPFKRLDLIAFEVHRGDRAVDAMAPHLIEHRVDIALVPQREQQHPEIEFAQPAGKLVENLGIKEGGMARDEDGD